MQQLTRLLRYVAPYWWQLLSSVLLMAAVGLLDAFRVLLIGPIFDRVLNPGSPSRQMQLFKLPVSGNAIYLQQFVPSHFQNPWTVVAFALVAATVLKGILDYAGTYLVNYAGFGMITDLRNDLYNSVLRRSAAFSQKHTTGSGQDQLADIQNILHESITGNRIVKAFSMESWEIARFRKAARRLFRANLRSVAAAAISSPLMDIFGAIAIALLLLLGRDQI